MLRSLLRIWRRFRRRTYPTEPPELALEPVPCPACSSDRSQALTCIDAHRFCRCRECLTIFQSPRLSADLLNRQYDRTYFESEDIMTGYPDYEHRKDLQIQTAEWQWKEVEKISTGRQLSRILDVGCGSSHFLRLGFATEKDCWGVDLIDLGSEPHIEFRLGSFLEVDLPESFFDLIVFNDSFEHFPASRGCAETMPETAPSGWCIDDQYARSRFLGGAFFWDFLDLVQEGAPGPLSQGSGTRAV